MKIDEAAMKVLEQCRVEGNKLFIPPTQLDRKLYEKVNKALDAMGGKWNRPAKAHVFPEDPTDLLEQALETGEVTSVKQELQYFPTPEEVIDIMLQKLRQFPKVKRVLEPSAGEGAIAKRLEAAGYKVEVCELHEPFRKKLVESGFKVLPETDFLQVKASAEYDAVVANPPFTGQADIDHVSHMLDMVKPGGVVISVMSSGMTFRENKKTQAFREKLDSMCNGYGAEPLPDGSFKSSGTAVNTVILMAPKRMKT